MFALRKTAGKMNRLSGAAAAATNNTSSSKQPPEREKCPRCDSTNTKFCYYNNYNKSQPRHFCKSCKRHWTVGGILRAVPVGGAARKNNKRLKTTEAAATVAPSTSADVVIRAHDHDQFPRTQMIVPLGQVTESSPSPSPSSFGYALVEEPWESSWSAYGLDVLVSSTTSATDHAATFSVPWDIDDELEFFKP